MHLGTSAYRVASRRPVHGPSRSIDPLSNTAGLRRTRQKRWAGRGPGDSDWRMRWTGFAVGVGTCGGRCPSRWDCRTADVPVSVSAWLSSFSPRYTWRSPWRASESWRLEPERASAYWDSSRAARHRSHVRGCTGGSGPWRRGLRCSCSGRNRPEPLRLAPQNRWSGQEGDDYGHDRGYRGQPCRGALL